MNFAIFIDADNFDAIHAAELFATIKKLGNPITRRAFGNPIVFTGKNGWKEAVRKFGIEARPQVNHVDGKNSADFALVIDAMACLYTGRYDGFVIASSDSDFTSLAIKLRDEGKCVYGFGDNRAPESFRNACTSFVELETQASATKVATAKSATAKQSTTPSATKPATPNPTKPAAAVKQKVLYAGKDSAEFFSIASNLRLSKATSIKSLKAVMKNQHRTDTEADQIIQEMQRLGILVTSPSNKITWCTAEKLKKLQKQHTGT